MLYKPLYTDKHCATALQSYTAIQRYTLYSYTSLYTYNLYNTPLITTTTGVVHASLRSGVPRLRTRALRQVSRQQPSRRRPQAVLRAARQAQGPDQVLLDPRAGGRVLPQELHQVPLQADWRTVPVHVQQRGHVRMGSLPDWVGGWEGKGGKAGGARRNTVPPITPF